jgi:hypothetical protein
MSYINPSVTNPVVVTLFTSASGNLTVPALQNVTINNANDVFTWSQLDSGSKLQVATLSTNSISTNAVLDKTAFFGNVSATANSAAKLGLLGLSSAKTLTSFTVNIGDKTLSGNCYITGLAPTVSADSPVWVSPVTFTVSGEYAVA